MVAPKAEIRTFDDFREYSLWYLRDVGLTTPEILGNEFKIVLAKNKDDEVEFGDFKGRKKFKGPEDFPSGEWNGRSYVEILANLANIQGDTEFGSNEQQVGLWESAPSEYDRKILLSVINEEFRHGWQMGFFETDVIKTEEAFWAAQSLLERRSGDGDDKRLLGAFNNPITDWIGMYCFLEFMDRDGGSQLTLLARSAVEDLSRSMLFMLREEAKHLRSGQQGFERMCAAGKLPIDLLQKYVNLFAPLGYDLHGGERSTNALIYYKLGLKGFYPSQHDYLERPAREAFDPHLFNDLVHRERNNRDYGYKFVDLNLEGPAEDINKELLNGITVTFYKRALESHFEKFNELIRQNYPAGTPELVLPSIRFHRDRPSIYAGEYYDIHGRPIESKAEYQRYLEENLPSEKDKARLEEVFAESDWLAPPELDVYKTPTKVQSTDEVLYETVFGERVSKKYTFCLSKAAKEREQAEQKQESASSASDSDDQPFWAFMDAETD
ncbi:MAG: hypothetical protein RL885_32975 [Planctomycetota bacterium]